MRHFLLTNRGNSSAVLKGMEGSGILKYGNPLAVHYAMFIKTIADQGTDEQRAEWVQRAKDVTILGTYAQTELGHGTFVRGLETTATYDAKTKEFVLNSPTLSSYKWWPGNSEYEIPGSIYYGRSNAMCLCSGTHIQSRRSDGPTNNAGQTSGCVPLCRPDQGHGNPHANATSEGGRNWT